ncbi:7-cyano-7-deazaguanine synthase QueC [Bradyrhizobium sp. INPA03-11B]|uniref:7-cyano-7-deazaguanine synthase QueC n=1 Tax=Bradyrhizobium sp. INPA03-11B TaxID=418598 RepID=UPI00338E6E2E
MEAVLGSAALVLFSGGQDSTTCLAWALSRFDMVATIGFGYGQRHAVELEARKVIFDRIAAEYPEWKRRLAFDHVVQLELIRELGRERFDNGPETVGEFETGKRYIPARNLLFVTMAAIVAFRTGISDLVCGVSEAEYSGYPDCTETAVSAMEAAVSANTGRKIRVHAPLMDKTKADVWRLAQELGGGTFVDLIVRDTHTCYAGQRNIEHAWGFGCGDCNACRLRSKGHREFTAGGALG